MGFKFCGIGDRYIFGKNEKGEKMKMIIFVYIEINNELLVDGVKI